MSPHAWMHPIHIVEELFHANNNFGCYLVVNNQNLISILLYSAQTRWYISHWIIFFLLNPHSTPHTHPRIQFIHRVAKGFIIIIMPLLLLSCYYFVWIWIFIYVISWCDIWEEEKQHHRQKSSLFNPAFHYANSNLTLSLKSVAMR